MEQKTEAKRGFWILLAGFALLAGLTAVFWRQASAEIPDIVGRELTAAEQAEVVSRNSPLTQYVALTANASFPRTDAIQKITVHHMAGNMTLEGIGGWFGQRDRRASSNYAVDSQGNVGLYVEECNRSWASSNRENDNQAVTIEVANDEIGGEWHVSDEAFAALVDLCTDICRRNNIPELAYTGGPEGTLTTHKMFTDTQCPGPYLESRMAELAEAVNRRLKEGESP